MKCEKYTYIHTYIRITNIRITNIHIYIWSTRIYIGKYVYIYAWMYVYIYVCVYKHIFLIHASNQIFSHFIYICMCINIYIYIYTHTCPDMTPPPVPNALPWYSAAADACWDPNTSNRVHPTIPFVRVSAIERVLLYMS